MLMDVETVVENVATLMDDPGQTSIDSDYVVPFLNLRWDDLCNELSVVNLQYQEATAFINIPANTLNLTPQMAAGGPLASFMQPVSIDWKPQGADDTEYTPVARVRKLDDVPQGVAAIAEYAFIGGTVTLQPASVPLTLRVTYNAMSTTLVDPTDDVVRGTASLIAYRTAELMWAIKGNAPLQKTMRDFGDQAVEIFLAMSVMRQQSELMNVQPTHRRGYGSAVNFTMPPGYNF